MINFDLKIRTNAFRKYMGPSGNGISDRGLRKLAGWTSFIAGYEAAVENMKPIKPEPLCKRSMSA